MKLFTGSTRRFKAFSAILVASALTLAACGSDSDDTSSDDPVRIMFVAGVSGPTAKPVKETTQGIEAAINEVNANGGAAGRKLELEVLDTGGDPTRAVSELQRRLSSGNKPHLVIPGVSSVEALAMMPMLTREKIVSINNAASPDLNNPEEYPYHFGYTPSTDRQQTGLPAGLEMLNAKSVVALVGNDAYGKTMGEAVESNLDGTDIDVEVQTFNLEDLDLSIAWERAIAANPDAIFFEAIGDPAQRLVEAREAIGATDIPAIGGFGINSTNGGPSSFGTERANINLYTQLFAAQEYVAPEDRSDTLNTYFSRMDEVGGVGEGNSVQSSMISYDYIRIFAAAVDEAGSTDAEKATEALVGDMDYPALALWSSHRWTSDYHFPKPAAEEFTTVPRGELVDGLFKPFDN